MAVPHAEGGLAALQAGGAGSLSLLYVAQQVYASASLVTNKAVVAPLAPRLALAADAGDWRRYRRAYRARLR